MRVPPLPFLSFLGLILATSLMACSRRPPSDATNASAPASREQAKGILQQQVAAPANARAGPVTRDRPGTTVAFKPPSDDQIPNNEFGNMVRLGRNIFVNTQVYAKGYVGNGLNCVNCHLDAGRLAHSAPLWAAYVKYPAYRSKNKKVNSYQDRLAGCFRFSENGKPPAFDSKEMTALVTYSYWLAKGAPTGVELPGRGYPKLPPPALKPDVRRGAQVFVQNCAICHGADGQGTKVGNQYAFPPLWGPHSYNWGAGMHVVATAAAFIRANMPLGKGNTLSVQDAWDVAQFVDTHDRPLDPRNKLPQRLLPGGAKHQENEPITSR